MTRDQMFELVVVVPANDEEDRVAACVESIAASLGAAGGGYIVIVDDSSIDRTAERARRALDRSGCPGAVIRATTGCASAARTVGVRAAQAMAGSAEATVVLSTDADSLVPVSWASAHRAHHRIGEMAVAGVVELIDDDDGRAVGDRWRLDYGATIAEDRTHPHVHAANLSVRLDAYAAAGGFGSAHRAEDIDLWRRLREHGYQPVADASIVVETSARKTGRVAEGFAHALDRLYGDRAEHAVVAS